MGPDTVDILDDESDEPSGPGAAAATCLAEEATAGKGHATEAQPAFSDARSAETYPANLKSYDGGFASVAQGAPCGRISCCYA